MKQSSNTKNDVNNDTKHEDQNKYADKYPSWSLMPKNQLINRVKRND